MVNEERISEILSEEKARRQIAEQLRKENSDKGSISLWDFVNSNFGLMLFSSVLVSLVVWVYGEWQSAVHEQQKTQELRNRLVTEVSFRGQVFRSMNLDYANWDTVYDAQSLNNGDIETWLPRPVFQEYVGAALPGLIYRLTELETTNEAFMQSGHFETALEATRILAELDLASIVAGDVPMTEDEVADLSRGVGLLATFADISN